MLRSLRRRWYRRKAGPVLGVPMGPWPRVTLSVDGRIVQWTLRDMSRAVSFEKGMWKAARQRRGDQ